MQYALLGLFSLNFLAAAGTANDSVLFVVPHVVDGGSWRTTLKFVNLGTHDVTLLVQFLKDGAENLAIPVSIDGATPEGIILTSLKIKPGQTSTMATTGSASNLSSGWAVAYQTQTDCCPEPMGALAIYTQHVPGRDDQEAAVTLGGPITRNLTMMFDNTAYSTGFAILNMDTVALPLVANIRDRTGKVIDQQTLLLPKNTHVPFVLADLWRSTAGIAGSIEFVNSGGTRLSAFGLRFNSSAFTTFNAFTVVP